MHSEINKPLIKNLSQSFKYFCKCSWKNILIYVEHINSKQYINGNLSLSVHVKNENVNTLWGKNISQEVKKGKQSSDYKIIAQDQTV